MVTLSLNPKRGNHARYFPHSGYLGLTPVVVSGTVHTRLEEDRRPLEAARLVVRLRCYEAAGVGIRPDAQTCTAPKSAVAVLWQTERTLWAAPHPGEPFVALGDADFVFRLAVPTQAVEHAKGGHAVGSITYKTWRTWWQVETVIYHRPSGMMGSKLLKSHTLFLSDYSRPSLACTSLPPPSLASDSMPLDGNKRSLLQSSCGRLAFTLTAPSGVSCGDVVRVGYGLTPLLGSSPDADTGGLVVKRVSVALVRTLSVVEPPEPETRRWKLRRPAGARPMTTLATTLVEADARKRSAALGSGQCCEGDVGIVVPMPKSRAHYSVGESCRTRLAAVSYMIVLKVTVKSKLGGVEKMQLGGLEVRLSSVSASDLRDALAHIERLRLALPRPGPEQRRGEVAKSIGGEAERRGVEGKIWSTSTLVGERNESELSGDRRVEQERSEAKEGCKITSSLTDYQHHRHHYSHHQQQQIDGTGKHHHQRKLRGEIWRSPS